MQKGGIILLDNFMIQLSALLNKAESKKRLNGDIKHIEKSLNMLRLTAILSKGESKKLLNQYVKQLGSQLNHIKLQAKLNQRELKSEINSTLNNLSFKDIDIGVSGNKTKIKLKKVIADAKKTVQNNPISLDITLKKEKLQNQLTSYLAKNTKIRESSILLKEAKKLRDIIEKADDAKSFRTASNNFQLYKSSVQAAGFQTKSTTDKLRNLVGNVTKIGTVFGVATTAVGQFKKSLETIKTNDTILTEISKTSNMTKSQLTGLGLSSFQKASKYGRTSSDYLVATQEMSRSGFYGKQGEGMAEQSLLAQAAGDLQADTANNYVLATNAAYKLNGETKKLNAVLDGQNNITNRNSVAMEDMAEAMSKAGTVAAGYRVSVENLSAMIGTVESVTKAEGSEVGNSIKTIIMNLQNITSDKIVDTLDEANASMTETVNGAQKLRDPISILRDLAKTYKELDENDPLRAKIVTNIGTKYHAAKLSALLQNMDMFDKMLNDYSEGSGSAMEEAEKSANSLEGCLNTLQNSWDSLVVSFANSDMLKGGVSFLNGMINGAETLIDTLGAIPLAITALNGAMTALNKDYGITQVINPETKKMDLQGNLFGIDFTAIKQQKKHFEEASNAIAGWNNKLKLGQTDINKFGGDVVQNNAHLKEYLKTCSAEAPASLEGYKAHLAAAGVGTDALRLKTVLLNSAIGMGIGLAIQGAISGISYLINYEEKQKEAFEKAKAATEEAAKSIRDLKSEMSDTSSKAKDLSSEFANLVQGVNPFTNENEHLSTEQYEKFLDVNNQLAELFPSLTKNYDENGNAILGLSGDVDSVTASIAKLVEQQNNLAKADMRNKLDEYVNGTDDNDGVFTALKGSKKEVADAEKDLEELKAAYDSIIKGTGEKAFSVRSNDYYNFLENVENRLGKEASDAIREIAVVPKGRNTNEGIKIDFSQLVLDEQTKGKITESYNTFYRDLQTTLSVKQSELETKNQEMSNMMMLWVEDLDLYKNSNNKSFQRAIESMIGSIQWSDLDVEEENIEEAKQLIQSLVITPLSGACNDPDKKLQVTNAINSLFTIDFSKLSYKEASEKIKGFITILMNAMNAYLPEGQKKKEADLYSMLGLTEYQDSADKMKSSLSSIAKEGSSDYQKLENYTVRFTQKQSEAWLSATNGAKSADEAIQNYENSLKTASQTKPKSFTSAWKSLGKADDSDSKQKLLDAADAGELTGEKVKELAKEDENLKKEFEATGLSADKFAESIREIHLDDIQGDINECEKALQKMKNGQSLSTEETAKLISENSSLAGSIKKTKDGYKIEEDALISVMNTSKQKYNVVVANEILETNKVIDAVKKRIDAYKSELKAIQTAMEARQMEYNTITDGGTSNDRYGLSPDETSRALLGNPQATQDYSASITIPKKIAKDEKKLKDYQKKLKKLQKSMQKLSGSSGGKKDKSKQKDSKQTFDWMERRFKNLQNVIDFTASKLQNLFSVKAKNSNLNKQIKTTTKLINEYGIAAKKYQQKADQVAAASTKTVKGKNGKKKKVKTKALSKDIIQKIQTGKFTKKTNLSSLITEYGKSTAERIQSYIDYYDKAQDAKKNKQEQKAKKRELKQQKYQNYADLYDSRTARAEAKEAIQTNAKDKNKAVDTQLKNTKLSYQYQIRIANLTRNKAEAEKLQYEMEKKVAELKLQQIQNLQDEYDKRVGLIDNDAQDIDNAIALAQARGQTLSAGYYQSLNRLQTTKRQEAVNEKSKVEATLAAALKDGSIKKDSDEWYEVQSTLQGLENTINECDVAIAENTTAIRELHTTMLEEMAENANRMNTEADFLANLLSRKDLTDSDTGTFTNAGLGTLGTYGINMETAQAQMRELEKERAILEQMKKTGSLDYGDNGKHKYDSVNQLEDAYNDILDKQQEWTQNEYDAEQKIIDLMKQYYQAQLDYMKEIIEGKKKILSYEKDLFDYQKSIAEKTKSIATLEKQAAALKGDNSEEGRARLAKIQLSLDEANQDLADTELERFISDQQNMLDNMYSEYEDLMNHLFKDTDKLLQEGIDVINKNGELIKSIFDKTAADYSYDYSDHFRGITDAFTASDKIVTGIQDSINGKEDSSISKRLETINTTIESKYNPPSSGDGDKGGGGGGGDPKPPAPTNGGTTQQTQTKKGQTTVTPEAAKAMENSKSYEAQMFINTYGTTPKKKKSEYSDVNKKLYTEYKKVLSDSNLKKLATKLGVTYNNASSTGNLYKKLKELKVRGFQTGGIVRANGVPLKGDNIPIRVNPNETVLTQDFTDILPMAVDVMDQFVKEMNLEPYTPPNATLAKLASLAPSYDLMSDVKPPMPKPESVTNNNVSKENFGNQTFGDINVCLELPNVSDYKSFREEMRSDGNSRHMFEVMVDDCLYKRGVTKRVKL